MHLVSDSNINLVMWALLLLAPLLFAAGYFLGRHRGYVEGLAEGKRTHFENAMHFLTKSIQ